jgi:hypothetical protein
MGVQGSSLEVINVTENPIENIIADLVSILYNKWGRDLSRSIYVYP